MKEKWLCLAVKIFRITLLFQQLKSLLSIDDISVKILADKRSFSPISQQSPIKCFRGCNCQTRAASCLKSPVKFAVQLGRLSRPFKLNHDVLPLFRECCILALVFACSVTENSSASLLRDRPKHNILLKA